MIKTLSVFLCSLFCCAAYANESEWNKAFNVIWESQWQQNGIPLPAMKWPAESKSIKFSINRSATSTNANRVREALATVTKVIDWKAIEVDEGSADVQMEITIRRYSNEELRQFICHVVPESKNLIFTKQKIMMSEQYAYQCVLHELMHAFGFPGHPEGDTVLSYFEGNQRNLKPMDEFLLQAWYGDTIKVGVLPFTTIQELTRLWVEKKVPEAQQEQAWQAQQLWYRNMIQNMENFAFNKGQAPTILYRSGLISSEGIRFGRTTMQAMLGTSYLFGLAREKNTAKAGQLLLLSAQNGNEAAAGIIARQIKAGSWSGASASASANTLCQWMFTTPAATTQIPVPDQQAALDSKVCKQALVP